MLERPTLNRVSTTPLLTSRSGSMNLKCQGFFWVVFADNSGRERMGAEEIKIKMRVPARKIHDGGVADLQPAGIVEEELKEAEDQVQAAAEDPIEAATVRNI